MGFQYKKNLGQNFLQDNNVLNKIVASVSVGNNDLIIEIGPGHGALTKKLVDMGCDVLAFEIDLRVKEYLDKIDACTPCRYHAPTVLVVAYDKNNVFDYPGNERNSGIEDAAIVATHLMLAAYNAGIDSCWINFFNPQEMKKALDLPENEEVVMMLDLGYGNQQEPLPNHHLKKELAETVKYL